MRKFVLFFLLTALVGGMAFTADNITGLWKTIDDKTGKPSGIVILYLNQGKLYGRLLATINKPTGVVEDTIYTKKLKADKVAGSPPNCGLDIVYQVEEKGKEWKGLIMDPASGEEYDCVITPAGNKLTVRGQLKGLGFLGRNQTWMASSKADLPADFVLPDPATFIPVIPKKAK